jgi:hypothetical protein
MITTLIIVVLTGGQISAAHVDYPSPAACELHRQATLHDPVQIGKGPKPIVVAVCREVEAHE